MLFGFINTTTVQAVDNNYVVKPGDSLWSIANRFNTTVENIRSANQLKSDALQIGDNLTIPGPGTDNKASNSSSGKKDVYYVQAGDSLWSIAASHGMTVNQLKLLNGNCTEQLSIGQKLNVQGEAKNRGVVSRSSSAAEGAGRILQRASQFLGTPYRYGGQGPDGFDCSGFVCFIFSEFGYNLPHNAASQASLGQAVSRAELQPGDLVFFTCGGAGINHVGIYCGNDRFIHSSSPRSGGVIYSSLTDSYWGGYYISASRILK